MILSIGKSEINKYPNIIKRIREISEDCNDHKMQISFMCAVYDNDCNSEFVIYIDDETTNNLKTINDLYSNKITSFLLSITFNDVNEIYEVCTSKKNRREGHMGRIFEAMEKGTLKPIMWLGVRFDNPIYEQVVKFYSKHNFGSPEISDKTYSGKQLNFKFLSLTFKKEKKINPESTFEKCMELKLKYEMQDVCKIPVHIHKHILDELKKFLFSKVEYSGSLANEKILTVIDKNTKQEKKLINLVYLKNSENSGNENGVSFSRNGAINFHTHPYICYNISGCSHGWPSGQDMKVIIHHYIRTGLKKHFVISSEGVYSIQLSLSFQRFIDKHSEWNKDNVLKQQCIVETSELVYKIFTLFETERKIISENWYEEFLKVTNNYNIEELAKIASNIKIPYFNVDVKDAEKIKNCGISFVLFDVKLYSWGDISSRDGLIDNIIVSSACDKYINYLPMIKETDGEKLIGSGIMPDKFEVSHHIFESI